MDSKIEPGVTVSFKTAPNAKPSNKQLNGVVNWIKFSSSANNEYIQIKTKNGVFHKTTKSVTKES